MFQRQTQDESYWAKDFTINDDDLDFISNRLLEKEQPLPIEDLTKAVIRFRVEKEVNSLRKLLSQGIVYKPTDTYQKGDQLVFPALEFATGTVVNVRPGSNPEYGNFEVLKVKIDGVRQRREFAMGLGKAHDLNALTDTLTELGDAAQSSDELYQKHGKQIREKLTAALAQRDDLIELFRLWFLKALVPKVGPGYLNIAEAILDIAEGGPKSPADLLSDLDLPAESQPELLEFSLNYALYHDERFDEVGPAGEVMWYLRRLEPAEVLYPPKRLVYTPVQYDRDLLNLTLRKLEQELDDEWSSGWEPAKEPSRVSFTLTFPHWKNGTLPLSSRIAPLFPTSYEAPRIRCKFIDKHSKTELEAWVVWEGRFVHGLIDWYRENQLPIGAYLHVSPGSSPGEAIIEYEKRRPQQEWIRVATVSQGNMLFGMQKRTVATEYDDMMMIGFDESEPIDEIWEKAQDQQWSLAKILVRVFPELAKLSPQSTVHSKTLYSAVNMIFRCPPGPIFAELVRQPCFLSMGENYWQYNPSLWSGD